MITIWGRRSSINVQKVLWAAAETGVEFERQTVGGSFGGTDTKEYRKLNPMGLIPVIRDNRLVLFESNAIVRYLARKYGRGSILPRGQKAYALADQWMEWSTTVPMLPLGTIFMNKIRKPADQYDAKAVKDAEKVLSGHMKLANRLLGRKPFVAGRHLSYGDIPFGTLYHRYKLLEIERPKLPNLDRWYEQLQTRPAYKEWVAVPFGRNLAEWNEAEKKLK